MTNLVPRSNSTSPVVADDDNRYKAVQARLNKLGKTMDDFTLKLEALRRRMQANATHTDGVATDIEHADLDPKFVGLTANVAVALVGAAREVRRLADSAQEAADLTHEARRSHAKLYGALDDVRSNRREKTPRPGFFNR